MTTTSNVRLSDVKIDLKKLGCKIKSQLDGSWAIHEPKGVKVIVPTLEAAQEYCRSKSVGSLSKAAQAASSQTQMAAANNISSISAAPKSEMPMQQHASQQQQKTAPQEKVPAKPEPSPEQQKAISAVGKALQDMKENRLRYGLNFLHSEIKDLLQHYGCPEPMKEKAIAYAETKLQKDCQSKNLVSIVFRHPTGQKDTMYFDAHYAQFLNFG